MSATNSTSCATEFESSVSPVNRFKSGRHLIYTVIAGDYDSLKRPLWRPQNVDYLAFVSEPEGYEARGWRLSKAPNHASNPKLVNRKMKILGIDLDYEYDSLIYIDGSIQIVGSLEHTIARFLESENALGLFRHDDRNSPWDELATCNKLGYLSQDEHRFEEDRLKRFKDEGIVLDLFDAGIILKNPRQEALTKISTRWFELFTQNPVRDQLSLPIVVWEHRQDIFQLEHWLTSCAPTFLRYPHKAAGRVIKSVFWFGSACPRPFQMIVTFARHHRRKLAEPTSLR